MAEAERRGFLDPFRALSWPHAAALALSYVAMLGALGPWGDGQSGFEVILTVETSPGNDVPLLPIGWLLAALAFGAVSCLLMATSVVVRGVGAATALGLAALFALLTLLSWTDLSWGLPLAIGASVAGGALAVYGMLSGPTTRPVVRAWVWEAQLLALAAAFMFWVRMLPYKAVIAGDRVYYVGTDPYYHFRATLGIVRSFPDVPRFDPYTYYPHGTPTGQFGSLFDWLTAAVVVVTQGREASEPYIAQVLGVMPAVLGALLVVPFYFLAKRLFGGPGAVVATVTLTFLSGEFLIRSIAGYADHHVMEALMALVSILGVVASVDKAHAARAAIVWRDPASWWRVALWGVLGGVALWLNFLAWPPALLFLAILLVWLVIAILLEDGRGGDATGLVLGGAVPFVVAGLLMVPFVETTFLGEFNTYGLLHVVAPLAAAAGLALVHLAVRALASRDAEESVRQRASWIVAGALAALGIVGFFALRFVSPAVYSSLKWGLSWITGIAVPRTTNTISEARGSEFFCTYEGGELSCLSTKFGLVPQYTALILLGLLAFAVWKRRRADILLLLWSGAMFLATQTQIRFSYYLAVSMALLVGWLGARIVEASAALGGDEVVRSPKNKKAQKRRASAARGPSAGRAVFATLALLAVLPGNVFAFELDRGDADEGRGSTWVYPGWVTAARGFPGPDQDLLMWIEALEWMRANTPDSGVRLETVVDRPPGGQHYDHPDGTYGVLSWWDYGHWTEVVARRAPVANPFQQAAPFASCWFMERDPARAEAMLSLWSQRTWSRPEGAACTAVRPDPATPPTDEHPIRYVMIDDEMAAGKFGAITVWANCDECLGINRTLAKQPETRDELNHLRFWYWRDYLHPDGGTRSLPWNGEVYQETMMSRLYFGDATGLANYRLVHELPYGVRIGWVAGFDERGELFTHAQNNIISDRRGWTPAEWSSDTGNAMFRTDDARYIYEAEVESSVKTFEHVKGARVTGADAAPGATATVRVDLINLETNRTFAWEGSAQADAAGRWNVTVPYATAEYVPASEGGTNYVIVARGPAEVRVGGTLVATIDIRDRTVLDGSIVEV